MLSFPTFQSLPPWREESDNESLMTDDEFDHPRGLGRVETKHHYTSENAQHPASVGPSGTEPAADARPPAEPRGASLFHGVAGAPPVASPSRPLGMPLRLVGEAGPLARAPPGDWSWHANPARAAGEPGDFSGELAATRALEERRAQLVEQEQLLTGLLQQARETRQRIIRHEAEVAELERQRRQHVDNVPGAPAITTLMISNIPMDVTQGDLLDLIDQTGFARRYDFAYMPTDFDAGTSKGHAYVNFTTSRDAREFSIKWDGSRLAGAGPIAPVLEVKAAARQGFEENAKRWKERRLHRVKNPKLHPFIAQRSVAS